MQHLIQVQCVYGGYFDLERYRDNWVWWSHQTLQCPMCLLRRVDRPSPNTMYRLQLPWAKWQGAEIPTVATHAFWLCRQEVLLVLMLLHNSMHSGAYSKEVQPAERAQQCGQRSIWNSCLYFSGGSSDRFLVSLNKGGYPFLLPILCPLSTGWDVKLSCISRSKAMQMHSTSI